MVLTSDNISPMVLSSKEKDVELSVISSEYEVENNQMKFSSSFNMNINGEFQDEDELNFIIKLSQTQDNVHLLYRKYWYPGHIEELRIIEEVSAITTYNLVFINTSGRVKSKEEYRSNGLFSKGPIKRSY